MNQLESYGETTADSILFVVSLQAVRLLVGMQQMSEKHDFLSHASTQGSVPLASKLFKNPSTCFGYDPNCLSLHTS